MSGYAHYNDNVVTNQQLESFIDYITGNEGTGQSSFGIEIEFYERNNFHHSIANRLFWDFPYWVNRSGSPICVARPDGGAVLSG